MEIDSGDIQQKRSYFTLIALVRLGQVERGYFQKISSRMVRLGQVKRSYFQKKPQYSSKHVWSAISSFST